ncbi:YncE family protein [Friedmanniella luteola]|nr:hypothetical protein [Friedmanniella luteola]
MLVALLALLALAMPACTVSGTRSPSARSSPAPSTSATRPAVEPTSSTVKIAGRVAVAHPPPKMAIDPDNELYTSDHGTVTITDIDKAESGEFPRDSIEIGVVSGGLAVDPASGLLYAGTQTSTGQGVVAVVNIDRRLDNQTGAPRKFEVVDRIPLRSRGVPHQLALDREAHSLFVLTSALGTVAVIDTRNREIVAALPVGFRQSGGHEAVALGVDVDTRAGTAIVSGSARSWIIDTTSLTMTAVETGGGGPVTVDSTTGQAFIPNEGDGTVTVLDTTTGAIKKTIQAAFHSGTGALAINPDLQLAYLPVAQDGMLLVLDTKTLRLVRKIPPPVHAHSWGELAVDTTTNFLYAADGGTVTIVTSI